MRRLLLRPGIEMLGFADKYLGYTIFGVAIGNGI
jgi:hypothetical protein